MTPPRLLTLGTLRLEGSAADALLSGRRKELVLLAYLARRAPRAVARAELTALLWEERDEARARHSLRQALHRLRQAVDGALEIGAAEVRLREGALELDARAFEQDVTAGRLREAAAHWAGDFLREAEEAGGEAFRSWLEAEREGLRRRLGWTLERLAQQAEQQGAWMEMVRWTERWAELLPYEEAAQLRLSEALRLAGRTDEAAARHAVFAARLRRDLGQEPSAAFLQLGETLRATGAQTEPRRPGATALFTPDMVGRAAAFAELTAAWSEVEAGEGAVVLVEGEEGIGKTRLCQEFLRWLRTREPEPLVLQASAYDNDAGAEHATLRRLLAALPGAPGLGGAADAALAELSLRVPALRTRFPRLPQPLGSDAALAEALPQVLRDVAAEVPILLLLDDLPTADAASQRLLLSLARECPGSVLVLLTGRSEPLESGGLGAKLRQLPLRADLRLPPLGEAEVQALLDSMLALDPEARVSLTRRLYTVSGGNPLYVVELVTALAEDGLLSLDAEGAWRLSTELAEHSLPLPARMREALRARLTQLDGAVRAVLEAAAVLDPRIDPEALERVAALPAAEFSAALDALLSRRLLREAATPPLAYEFTHEIARSIAQEQLGPARRRTLQRAVTHARSPALHLPRQLSSFIGREADIAAAAKLLAASQLLTLTGPAGTGKTRLGLEVAAERAAAFPDGVYFVNLAPVADPVRVLPAIAQVLGVKEQARRPLGESLQAYLREKQLLLVLDNFEQVVEAAPAVTQLLAAVPGLKVLVTSRVPLHVQGEQEYPVPPLGLPDPRRILAIEQLTHAEAVRLFLERAQAVRPDFALTQENAPAVAQICQRLDGLPLAIELAAARSRILSPEALLTRLQSRLKLLTGGARDLPQRQQTLRNAIAWSHDLLSEAEKVLFRRLAVFSGGRTLEAVEAVCAADGDPQLDVLEGTTSLVDKNLLRQEEAAGEPRFVMLETIHEFAREMLQESGEAEAVHRRHAEYFLALAEEAEPQLHGRQPAGWLARLEQEHDNLRTALGWFLAAEDGALSALRLSSALWYFWYTCGHIPEASAWLDRALARSEGIEDAARTRALNDAGRAAYYRDDLQRSEFLAREGLAHARRAGDLAGMIRALSTLETVASKRGEHDRAREFAEEAIPLGRAAADPRLLSSLLNNLGVSAYRRGDYGRARELYAEAVALSQEAGDESALDCTINNLAEAALAEGDLPAAATCHRRALEISSRLGKKGIMAMGLEGLASTCAAQMVPERAVRLYGAAAAIREAARFPLEPASQPRYDRQILAVRQALEEDVFAVCWAEGQAMSFEQAVAYALEEGGESG